MKEKKSQNNEKQQFSPIAAAEIGFLLSLAKKC